MGKKDEKIAQRILTGRREIITDAKYLDLDNLMGVIRDAMPTHLANRNDIDYLYKYYRGRQPILSRTKNVRPEIVNRIVENRAHQIVDFKTGYLVGEPIQYTSRTDKPTNSKNISRLNDFMNSESKAAKDKELADWQHIAGVAYRMVLPTEHNNDSPFEIFTLDPRNAFVIKANDIANTKLAGVFYTQDKSGTKTFSVYTNTMFFEITGEKITKVADNPLGMIPIIEYPANKAKLGVFEPVLPLLDAVNSIDSNRLDGIEQFVQSLTVLYNCDIDEDKDIASIRDRGLVILKSIGEAKADIKIISEQLDQQQTQTLKKDLIDAIITIVGMPSQGDGQGSDSSNNGAMMLKQGWQTAEARAKDSELEFKRSEMETLKIALYICETLAGMKLTASDVNIKFTRRNYEDIGSKSTVLTTLLGSNKVAPIDAFTVCGMFPDPEEACARGLSWMEEQQTKAQELFEKQAEQNPDGKEPDDSKEQKETDE